MNALSRVWALELSEHTALMARLSGPRPSIGAPDNPITDRRGIHVRGLLVGSIDPLMRAFGVVQTSYADFIDALAAADRGPDDRILVHINSPGGDVDGLAEAMAAMRGTKKRIDVICRNATSAAYGLASQATGRVYAANEWSRFGSVGIVTNRAVNDRTVSITSTDAPYKRPDVTTDEGRAAVRAELDSFHGLLVRAIATGRGTTPEAVNANYGRGGVVLAGQAFAAGMIDAIGLPGSPMEVRATGRVAQAPVGDLASQALDIFAANNGAHVRK